MIIQSLTENVSTRITKDKTAFGNLNYMKIYNNIWKLKLYEDL